MKLENPELMSEYFESIKEKYPDLTLEQVKEICPAPFEFLRKEIESGELPVIRLKYFGTFLVYEKRARSILERMKIQFQDLKLDAQVFFKKKEILDKFLKDK